MGVNIFQYLKPRFERNIRDNKLNKLLICVLKKFSFAVAVLTVAGEWLSIRRCTYVFHV